MALSPLTTTLLSAWLLKTTIQRNHLLGIAFVGVALVITGGHFTALRVAIGDLWMLYACLASKILNAIQDLLQQKLRWQELYSYVLLST